MLFNLIYLRIANLLQGYSETHNTHSDPISGRAVILLDHKASFRQQAAIDNQRLPQS